MLKTKLIKLNWIKKKHRNLYTETPPPGEKKKEKKRKTNKKNRNVSVKQESMLDCNRLIWSNILTYT